MTSRGGLKAHGEKSMGNYCISKTGIAMQARQLCRLLGPYNVRVNAIAPSLVRPDPPYEPRSEASTEVTEEMKLQWLRHSPSAIPLDRVAEPEEMAPDTHESINVMIEL